MKTTKLNLNDLKVNSFVTSLSKEKTQTVQGGGTNAGPNCHVFSRNTHNDTVVPCDGDTLQKQ